MHALAQSVVFTDHRSAKGRRTRFTMGSQSAPRATPDLAHTVRCTAVLTLGLLCCTLLWGAERRTVTLLFTNDLESAYDSTDAFWRSDMARIGGIGQLATLIKQERAAAEIAFLLDAGDIFTGSLSRRSHGAVAFDLMQLLDYDAMAIGNHEFEYGWKRFAEEKARAPFPVLGANLFYRGTDHPYAQPWTIIERGGVRLGVIGLLGTDAATALIPSNIAGVEVRDPVATLAHLVARLRAEVDLIVVLAHQGPTAPMQTDDEADPRVFRGNSENFALAGAGPGVDVILAGHTDAGTPEALVHPQTGTLIMQTWGQGQHLGRLVLDMDARGNITAHRSALLPVNADVLHPAQEVEARLAEWRSKYPELREIIGHLDGGATRRYYDEAPLGNLFADIVARAADARIGLMPSGALRRDLPAGAVRREELLDAFPFEDRIARVTLTGATLRALLERGFALERGLLQLSGLRVWYAPDRPAGERIEQICVGTEALSDERLYVIGTIEIIAAGGDAFVEAREALDVDMLEVRFAASLEAAFQSEASLRAPELGRVSSAAPPATCTL